MSLTRRSLFAAGAAAASGSLLRPALAAPAAAPLSPQLLARAMAALNRQNAQIANRDVIAIADFAQPSRQPRFHLVEVASGRVSSHLVAHGRGSDPGHTGWLEHFSNDQGSNATCAGAFCTN